MRSLRDVGNPYQHAPDVSIVRTDTCMTLARAMSTDLNSNAAHEIARHVTLRGERQVSQRLRM